MPKATGEIQGKISGRAIIDQLVRNMELGQFEMGYSVLVPCIFSLYLHPEDYARLTGIFDLIREDAKRALASRLEQWNAKPLGLGVIRGGKQRKPFKIACKDWAFEFFPDSEDVVPVGDVEIHSELNETPQPGYHGAKTTLARSRAQCWHDHRQNRSAHGSAAARRQRVCRDPLRRRFRAAAFFDDAG